MNFPALANQFEAEYNQAFCGPASSAMVLNAVRDGAADLPRDKSRIRPDDLDLPPGAEVATARYTQDTGRRPAQVLGEPVTINGKTVHDFGFQTRQLLDEMLRERASRRGWSSSTTPSRRPRFAPISCSRFASAATT